MGVVRDFLVGMGKVEPSESSRCCSGLGARETPSSEDALVGGAEEVSKV